jgi:hypothetical protein
MVETQGHDVDAITGPDGYPADRYLEQHWEFHAVLRVQAVDLEAIDPGIQGEQT